MMKGVKNMRQNKKKILLSLSIFLFLLLIMAVGYASFATQLRLSGSAEIIGAWDVRITNIEVVQASEGTNPGTPSFTNTSATFNAQLVKPKDEIIYRVTMQNLKMSSSKLMKKQVLVPFFIRQLPLQTNSKLERKLLLMSL